ncbi:MAG: Phosphoheptose isomerase [Ignavibacteria bacterium]|nr:Phosphoheptose isomerase [Ignavibacteria bacterium]
MHIIREKLMDSVSVKNKIIGSDELIEKIRTASEKIIDCYRNGGKVLLCGNGGSAADAQHIAAEFSGRFYYDRPPLYSEALHVNSSYLTAVANDYSFDEVYARLIRAMGKAGDVLIGISTSGNSPNILKAIEEANKLKMITIGMTGESGGKLKDICGILLNIPSSDTPRIQEAHITIGHIICEIVEKELFPKS